MASPCGALAAGGWVGAATVLSQLWDQRWYGYRASAPYLALPHVRLLALRRAVPEPVPHAGIDIGSDMGNVATLRAGMLRAGCSR